MGVIKRADLETYARDAVPLDFREMQRRADMLLDAARTHAAELIERAEAEKELLTETATGEGYQKGLEQGRADGEARGAQRGEERAIEEHTARLEALTSSWEAALESWESQRAELMRASKTELLTLAAHIAARIVKRTIELDPDVVVDQFESVVEKLVTPSDLRVRVNPEDIGLLERTCGPIVERASACRHVEFVADASLARGSCVAQTQGGGGIDASITAQLDRIVKLLLPSHDGVEYRELFEDEGPDAGETSAEASGAQSRNEPNENTEDQSEDGSEGRAA